MNLILAKLIGLTAVGLCSNYLLVTGAINALGSKLRSSITATVGYKLVLEDKVANQRLFAKMQLANCGLASICAVGLYTLLNPFIELWLGKNYLLPETTVALIVVYFYLHFVRKVPLLFRDAAGLFHQDRVKAVIELVLNVCLSWLLVQRYDIAGVFIAGIISTMCTCIWAEPYIVFHYGLEMSLKKYLLQCSACGALTIIFAIGWKYIYITILDTAIGIGSFITVGIAIVLSMSLLWGLIAWNWKR